MLTEGAGWWKKASVECVFKWVAPALVCVGRPPPQCPTHRNPSSHWSSSCGVEGGESRGERGMTGTHSAFYSSLTQTHTHTQKKRSPSSLFPLICPTSPVPLLPSFSSQLWLRTHRFLLREIKKREKKEGRERERERERERGERWWDASVSVTWRLRAKGGDVAHVCVCVCARALRSASAFVCVVPRVCLLSFLRVQ